jgi:uncharacterized protein with PQ loop repeat
MEQNGDRQSGGAVVFSVSSSASTLSMPEYLSYVFGALYLGLWSLSFYPQLWENHKRRNTYGLALEYVIIQPAAYFLFSIYTLVGRVEMIGRPRRDEDGVLEDHEQVDKADVAFSTHAFLLSSAILVQSLILPRGSVGDQRHIKRWCINLLGIIGGLVLLSFAIEISIDESNSGKSLHQLVVLPLKL